MKKIFSIISLMLLSFGIIGINTSDRSLNTKIESPISTQYTYIKQDGYINLEYNNENLVNESPILPRASVNMVNFDMDTRSQSFESFNPNSYSRKSGSTTLSTSSMINIDESLPKINSIFRDKKEKVGVCKTLKVCAKRSWGCALFMIGVCNLVLKWFIFAIIVE